MIYEPKNKSAAAILLEAGFSYDKTAIRGWTRTVNKQGKKEPAPKDCVVIRSAKKAVKYRRLHAFVIEGVIDMHLDTNEGGQHKATKFNERIHACIKEFYELDGVPYPKKVASNTLATGSEASAPTKKTHPILFLDRLGVLLRRIKLLAEGGTVLR